MRLKYLLLLSMAIVTLAGCKSQPQSSAGSASQVENNTTAVEVPAFDGDEHRVMRGGGRNGAHLREGRGIVG